MQDDDARDAYEKYERLKQRYETKVKASKGPLDDWDLSPDEVQAYLVLVTAILARAQKP